MQGPKRLTAALAKIPTYPFEGVLYRAIHLEALFGFHRNPPYPAPRPLYSLGAPRAGARFTPRNSMATLYMAEDPKAAFAEANPAYEIVRRSRPMAVGPTPPTVLVSARVRLERILDVTLPAIQQALGTNTAELISPWRPRQACGLLVPTQRLGALAFAAGRFQAIRYPSARMAHRKCLAIFTDHIVAPAFVEIYDPDGNVYERIPDEK